MVKTAQDALPPEPDPDLKGDAARAVRLRLSGTTATGSRPKATLASAAAQIRAILHGGNQ